MPKRIEKSYLRSLHRNQCQKRITSLFRKLNELANIADADVHWTMRKDDKIYNYAKGPKPSEVEIVSYIQLSETDPKSCSPKATALNDTKPRPISLSVTLERSMYMDGKTWKLRSSPPSIWSILRSIPASSLILERARS